MPGTSGTGLDPFQIAVMGLGPGFSLFNVATMGFGFEIEIIVPPHPDAGGGGFYGPLEPRPIIVRVRFKDKVWEQEIFVTETGLSTLEMVVAKFKGIVTSAVSVIARLNKAIHSLPIVRSKRK